MLVYITKNFKLGEFTLSEDAFGREIIEIDEFIKRYHAQKEFKELISIAHKFISSYNW